MIFVSENHPETFVHHGAQCERIFTLTSLGDEDEILLCKACGRQKVNGDMACGRDAQG